MLFLFLNYVIFFVNLLPIPSASQPQPAIHLLRFRDSLAETSRNLLRWNQTTSFSAHCHWPGISCYSTKDFRVTSLNLTSFGLDGVLENSISNLCPLPDLISLDLSGNNFTGTIPALLGNCSQLKTIFLNDNALFGKIPPKLFRSRKLQQLDLGYNLLSGIIPPEVGPVATRNSVSCQKQLRRGNSKSMWGLRNLKELVLTENRFNGSIPEDIRQCNQLNYLDLSGNSLTGQIPASVFNLRNLEYLFLYNNMFSGFIPSETGNCSSLVEIRLEHNQITGILPPEICDLRNLKVLHLFNNQIEGPIPFCIEKLTSLEELTLYNNRLTGKIPSGISNLTNLTFLSLAHNNLTGEIPSDLGKNNIPGLVKLDLTGNYLTGEIPISMCSGNSLSVLTLGDNLLTGSFPTEIIKCNSLTRVILRNNLLHGSIPHDMLNTSGIWYASKSRSIEDFFKQADRRNSSPAESSQNLHELQLGNNLLEGQIPCSLRKVHHFSTLLNLSMNRLSGEIPRCLGNLDKLEILDISSNNLSGEIPSETNNMVSLSFVNISFNHLSGQISAGWAKILDLNPESTLGNPRLCSITSNCGHHQKLHTRGVIFLAGAITISLLSITCLLALVYTFIIRIWNPYPSSPHQLLLYHRSRSEDLPEDLNFEDILRATEGWSDKYVIGRGKHGTVYRTESSKSRKNWAVKKVDLSETKFSTEMRTLSLIRHRNVLRMGGYSIRDGYGFIVTEYMPQGTLYYVLHQRKPQLALNWENRYRIALGIAQGLSYLHHDCVPQIIHRDIKSDNILLDSELEPKIGDFGAAKLDCDGDESLTISAIVGTLGYIAPENAYSTRLTDKCDVYSYGVVLLELLCRKLPVDPSFDEGLDIVSWVRKIQQDENDCFCCLDEEIQYWNKEDQQEALGMMDLALKCTEMVPDIRPSMRDVVGNLLKFNSRRKFSVKKRDHSSL
ncbi:hypothetical protein DH2020_009739 [Rehmannia glutinosa]|uniref:Protein kinase domain-containing protein n=1 Tax=Rehmannia glutinosa TaxID=99300 RepID=A0ABR0X9C3_REHGL